MSTKKVYISGFSYELGENTKKIEELEEIQSQPELITRLKEVGLENYRTTDCTPFDLAEKALQKLFNKVSVDPTEIDAVIFTTSSYWCHKEFDEYSLSDFLLRNNLKNAYPIASSFSFCANYITSLRTASQYIKSGEFKTILVIVSDRVADDTTRVVPPNISIGSDAASCCLLSSDPISNMEITGISQTINAALTKIDANKEFTQYMQGVAEGIITNVTSTLTKTQTEIDSITKVIPNNYNKWITPSMTKLIGFADEKVSLDNIPKIAHAGASDVCINIADYIESDDFTGNDNLLLLSTGPMMWASALIKSVN